jgi:hypothetical protein
MFDTPGAGSENDFFLELLEMKLEENNSVNSAQRGKYGDVHLLVLFRPGYLPHDVICSYLRQVTARTPNKTSQLLVTLIKSFFYLQS